MNVQGEGTAQLGMGGASTWEVLDEGDEETQESSTMAARGKRIKKGGQKSKLSKEKVDLDSEEEDVLVLTKEEVSGESSKGVSTVTTSLSELIMLESSTKDSNSEVGQSSQKISTGSAAVGSAKSSGHGIMDVKKDVGSHTDQGAASGVQESKGRTRGNRKNRKGSKT